MKQITTINLKNILILISKLRIKTNTKKLQKTLKPSRFAKSLLVVQKIVYWEEK